MDRVKFVAVFSEAPENTRHPKMINILERRLGAGSNGGMTASCILASSSQLCQDHIFCFNLALIPVRRR